MIREKLNEGGTKSALSAGIYYNFYFTLSHAHISYQSNCLWRSFKGAGNQNTTFFTLEQPGFGYLPYFIPAPEDVFLTEKRGKNREMHSNLALDRMQHMER